MNDVNESKINNPRRLEIGDEIVTYLTQLDKQLSEQGLDDTDVEEAEALINNVLSEIKSRCASLASDRRTSLVIEKIILKCNLAQLIDLCQRMSPYAVFLARNRYSSHVMQSLISRLCFLLNSQDFPDEESEQMSEAVLELLNPIVQEISWLSKDISASHVMRSCFCLLVGIPVIAERKGKGSKHQHSVSHSMTLESMLSPGLFVIDGKFKFTIPDEFPVCLENAALSLCQSQASVLHELLADASSSAVLSLLTRIFSSPTLLIPNGHNIADNIFRQAMEWPHSEVTHTVGDEDDEEEKPTDDLSHIPANIANSKMFYAMSGDKAASHFLETVIECGSLCTVIPVLYSEVIGQVSEYVKDNVANFVIQAICKRVSFEIDHLSIAINKTRSVKGNKKSDNKKAIRLLKQLILFSESLAKELCEENLLNEMISSKGGVVLWLIVLIKSVADSCELKEVTGISGKNSTEWRQTISTAIVNNWTSNGTRTLSNYINHKLTNVETKDEQEDSKTAAATVAATKKDKISSAATGKREGGVDPAKLILARQIGALLQLHHVKFVDSMSTTTVSAPPPLPSSTSLSSSSSGVRSLEAVLSAVAGLPSDTHKLIAQSGQLSRAILDPFIENHSSSNQFHKYITNVFMNIAWDLAGHYVGQHVFRNIFEKLADVKEKEKLMKILLKNSNNTNDNSTNITTNMSTSRDTLNRTKEGRNSLKLVDFDGYLHNSTEWCRSWKRQSQAKDLLLELELTSAAAAAGSGSSGNSGKLINNKHQSSLKNNKNDDNDDEEDSAHEERGMSRGAEGTGMSRGDGDGDGNDGINKKRKRKRSHKSSVVTAAAGGGADDTTSVVFSSNKKKSSSKMTFDLDQDKDS